MLHLPYSRFHIVMTVTKPCGRSPGRGHGPFLKGLGYIKFCWFIMLPYYCAKLYTYQSTWLSLMVCATLSIVTPERSIMGIGQVCASTGSGPGPEQFVNFSFRSVHFARMKLQLGSIPYSPTIGHGDRSIHLIEFDQKVIELFRPLVISRYLKMCANHVRDFTHSVS